MLPEGDKTGATVIRISILVMGMSGIVAQIMLLRELMVAYLGNELVLGVILANWMLMEAAGSYLAGRRSDSARLRLELFILLLLIFSLTLPASIILSRVFKTAVSISPGEAVRFEFIVGSSLCILLPVAVPHGALFTYGCRVYARYAGGRPVGRVYVMETLGSIAGGVLFTFVLVKRFDSFTVALMVSLLTTFVSGATVLANFQNVRQRTRRFLRAALAGGAVFLFLSAAVTLVTPLRSRLHAAAIAVQWHGIHVTHSANSIYGNITVTRSEEQSSFFTDGVLTATTPDPDIAFIEDFAHFAALFHENPKKVAVLSGGAGGLINELLKHPVQRIDYVELDPLLITLIQEYGSPNTRRELSDTRVRIHHTDGRFFLGRSEEKYDIIYVGLGSPQELQTNRLFTKEFFAIAEVKLEAGGMLVLSLPGSLTYLHEQLRNLNANLRSTLGAVFDYVRVIPGDVNFYFASNSEALMNVSTVELGSRHQEREITTRLISPAYIEYRLHRQWSEWFERSMPTRRPLLNSDFNPRAVLYAVSYANAQISPYLVSVFRWMERINFGGAIAILAGITAALAIIVLATRHRTSLPVSYAIFTTGFASMIFDLAIIFTFQSLYGFLYYQIGLLVTSFMAGVAAGGYLSSRRVDSQRRCLPALMTTECILICFSVALPFAFVLPAQSLDHRWVFTILYAIFLVASVLSGILVGVEFPLATALQRRNAAGKRPSELGLGRAAGSLYSADLLGGYFGGLFGGIILLPILGLKETCFLLASAKAGSLLLLALKGSTGWGNQKV